MPVEIVRQELRYVPLYSSEYGLIDASSSIKDAVPTAEDIFGSRGSPQSKNKKDAKTSPKEPTKKPDISDNN